MPCPDHAERAVRMALDMQARVGALAEGWRNAGHHLGFGVGIAKGEATLGRIGFDRRLDYAAIGRIPNLASRLCSEAKAGQVLVSEPVFLSVECERRGSPSRPPRAEGLPGPGAGLRGHPLARGRRRRRLKHDPEKWRPVFGKDHAQTKR